MLTEIELKFIATPQAAMALAGRLTQWTHQHLPPVMLTNIYFDTADNLLWRCKAGLRIRGADSHYEMTLKTAGQTVGGLHQCREYNVTLDKPELNLQLFSQNVWPQECDPNQLAQALSARFTTSFRRERWLVDYRDSHIEVALDKGTICAGSQSEPLCEIELELKNGKREDLLSLAEALAATGGLRLGHQSKAARGFELATGRRDTSVSPLPLLIVKPKATLEEGMQAAFRLLLNEWLRSENLWLRQVPGAQAATAQRIAMLRQTFSLFGRLIPRKASSTLRQKLLSLETALLQETTDALQCCARPDWAQAQLALIHWLLISPWKMQPDDKAGLLLQSSFKCFADMMLGRTVAQMKKMFRTVPPASGFADKAARLARHLTAVHLLAGSWPAARVTTWLTGWQTLLQKLQQNQPQGLGTLVRDLQRQPAFWQKKGRR